ncbi:hypothetical protein [Maritimibacter alkaliphilus]|uniref:hypothetical protein n=1 Tax=Maritimibacter alkaliphilus TaxID=404236 RepID=UPI001C939210|nr:hypothetical protein [Maritimibacter alkaliphilus]MBY6089232.1 hypothetical protein [Maritimibacter alkaliphilus]
MSGDLLLGGGILCPQGGTYLLAVPDEAEDDEVVICSGQRDGAVLRLTPLTDLEEIQGIISLNAPWDAIAEACAMTPEGEVFFLRPHAATLQTIPGAGYSRDDAKGIGRLTALAQVGEDLVATGYSGQVYRHPHGARGWTDISIPVAASDAHKPVFYDLAPGPRGALVFGGSELFDMAITPDMEAANEAGDIEALMGLFTENTGEDMMSLRLYDAGWRSADVAGEPGAIVALLRVTEGTLLFSETGIIYLSSDFDVIEVVYRPEQPEGFDDIKLWQGRPLLLSGNTLSVYRDTDLEPFDPPLPAGEEFCLSVSPAGDRILAVFPSHVQLFEAGAWVRLEVALPET